MARGSSGPEIGTESAELDDERKRERNVQRNFNLDLS